MSQRPPIYILLTFLLVAFFACEQTPSTRDAHVVDSLNLQAYHLRYINIDSSLQAARQAYSRVGLLNKQGKAEACNNLGFALFMKMDFESAEQWHKDVFRLTKNETELLIADIGLMKIYQRTAMNKEFYDYRNSAIRRMKRIREEGNVISSRHEAARMEYAFSEFAIVSAIYYYYLQQRPEALEAIDDIGSEESLAKDSSQWLYYKYIIGATGLYENGTSEQRRLREFDDLYTAWEQATLRNLPYFEANGLQGLANLMASPDGFEFFRERRSHALAQLAMPVDTLLPLNLGQTALQKFTQYGDLYQIAGTYVSIGRYLNAHGHYREALDTLTKALDCVNRHHLLYYHEANDTLDKLEPYLDRDTVFTELMWLGNEKVKTVPEWISRIRDQLSVSYAGLGMKNASNYNRNVYLDILDDTRQDKELESRYQALGAESKQLNMVLVFVVSGFLLVVVLFWGFNRRSKERNRQYMEQLRQMLELCHTITASIPMDVPLIQAGIDRLFGEGRVLLVLPDDEKPVLQAEQRLSREEQAWVRVLMPYLEWAADNEQTIESLSDERSRLEKQRYVYEQHIAANKRQNLIKKSCLAIVTGITPYIDRILNEVHKLTAKGYIHQADIKREKYRYIDELVTTINEYNDILALWIKMKQGTLSLNVETFALNELFALLYKGRRAFEMKRQTLEITSTDALVKADKALTLFMINTLAENARKYTPEGGCVKIYAHATPEYVEVSVEDNGRGLSPEDVERIIGEKVYDSSLIGMKDAADADALKQNKGSGFGLMNCKGIIEKYRKTNDLFRVCLFQVESRPGQGSRFYFRLPSGVRKTLGVLLLGILPGVLLSCGQAGQTDSMQDAGAVSDTIKLVPDSICESLLNQASDFADEAYFANIDEDYLYALQNIDSAIMRLNEHYALCAPQTHRFMDLVGEGTPAEITWWNELADTDFHVILDIRNEAAVAFLAMKQLDAYNYNNAAYTALYKLQGEDQSLEAYCRQLERSTTNKMVGLILCVLLLLASLIGYYLLYIRKRQLNRMNLEQVLDINKKIFAASLFRTQEQGSEALQLEDDTLKEIPQRIVEESFDAVNDLLTVSSLAIAVYNEPTRRLVFASNPPREEMPDIVQRCFDEQDYLSEGTLHALPLVVDVGEEHQRVGVLCLERREGSSHEADRLLMALVARYMGIAVFNAVVKLARKYRDIESAQEETHRASWEDGMLHVQNMVLDNCLSTIKHETIYYPSKIKQIIGRLNTQTLTETEERECVETIRELIEYYKGIFTILSSCASRQLEEVTFRRTVIPVADLLTGAQKYFRKVLKGCTAKVLLDVMPLPQGVELKVIGDVNQLAFLFENLISEALDALPEDDGTLRLEARPDGEFVRFFFTDTRREKPAEELNQLFYPNLARMMGGERDSLQGTEYLVCKQIIRDHDEFAGRRGCRINAEPASGGGFTVYFTIPRR